MIFCLHEMSFYLQEMRLCLQDIGNCLWKLDNCFGNYVICFGKKCLCSLAMTFFSWEIIFRACAKTLRSWEMRLRLPQSDIYL